MKCARIPLAGCLIAALGVSCASSPPTRQLLHAREAYRGAASSSAVQLAPVQLRSARQALERAELAHEQDPGSELETNLAYVAERRSTIAVVAGDIVEATRAEQRADRVFEQRLVSVAEAHHAEQADARAAREHAITARVEADRLRTEAQHRARGALVELSSIARIEQKSSSAVITLPSAGTFASEGDALTPRAAHRLDRVAAALAAQPADSLVRIEVHTDGRGESTLNRELSVRRAELVRDYLVERGVDPRRVEAAGQGESTPIADNVTEQGRAANRRIEILVLPQGGLATQAARH